MHNYKRAGAQLKPSDQDTVETARELRLASHWLMAPLRPFRRFGMFGTWIIFIVVLFGLRSLGMYALAGMLAVAYLVLCVYSWTIPWLLRRWMMGDE
jgi:predicted exporter